MCVQSDGIDFSFFVVISFQEDEVILEFNYT